MSASCLYRGHVVHQRLKPLRHRLRYSIFMMLLDIDELPGLARRLRLFSLEKFNILSFSESDHGDGKPGGLRAWLEAQLRSAGLHEPCGAIRVLCMPRILGHAFNPISLFFCHRPDGSPLAMFYEVNNTFGERHTYLIPVADSAWPIRQSCDKNFYVSPFMPMDMVYRFRVTQPGAHFSFGINAAAPDGPMIATAFAGARAPLTDRALLAEFLRMPALGAKIVAAIHFEALKLWLRGLKLLPRPAAPAAPVTITSRKADFMTSFSAPPIVKTFAPASISGKFLSRMLKACDIGRMSVTLPNGESIEHAGSIPGPHGVLVLRNWRAIRRFLFGGHLGFAEAYVDGDWDSPDLAALIECGALNQDLLGRAISGNVFRRSLDRLAHAARANTRRGSRRNIVAHYDLGNEFYASWLDRGMSYSSALFTRPGLSLEAAQDAKQAKIIEALKLLGGERILEIGCGWGGLAERLIREANCHVTGVTLSPSQLHHAQARLSASGLDGKHDLRLQDYREISGRFDRIVSIEMLEAVGAEYWPIYFARLRDSLTESGRAVLQVITIAERYYEVYRREPDFIQRHIFPGGMLPSKAILAAQIEKAGLALRSVEHFGESYAATLGEWQRRFQSAWPRLRTQGFDEAFRRKWEYYLAYCEGGFRAGSIDVGLYELCHAGAVP